MRPGQSGNGSTLNDGEDVLPWRGNFAAGGRFGNDGQFGATLGIDYSIRNFEIPQVEVDDADYTEYAVVNSAIGKYERDSGDRVSGWIGPRRGPISLI